MDNISDTLFAERLRLVREIRGLTQSQLSEKTKIPSTSISHLESNSRKPSFDNLRRLAKELEVSTDYLMGRVESEDDFFPDTLYRDLQKLTDSDRETIKRIAESMKK